MVPWKVCPGAALGLPWGAFETEEIQNSRRVLSYIRIHTPRHGAKATGLGWIGWDGIGLDSFMHVLPRLGNE